MKVTWNGEDELHPDGIGPSATVWCGVKFPKGVAVETDDPHILAKAAGNPFFAVEEKRGPGRPPNPRPE